MHTKSNLYSEILMLTLSVNHKDGVSLVYLKQGITTSIIQKFS